MKTIKDVIEDMVMATPLNTMGMGDAYCTPDGLMSEPICATPQPTKCVKKKKRKKHIKDFL
jgi:hypothetical protein